MFPSMNVEDLGAAVHSPDDGWLDPYSVLTGFRNKAKSMGAEFLADEVTGLTRSGNTVTAALLRSGQQIGAAQFVNAAGAWASESARCSASTFRLLRCAALSTSSSARIR